MSMLLHAGRFGFDMDMRGVSGLWEPDTEDNLNVRSLLDSAAEVVDRAKIYARWWRLWRADVRAGWVAFGRYKVMPRQTVITYGNALCPEWRQPCC